MMFNLTIFHRILWFSQISVGVLFIEKKIFDQQSRLRFANGLCVSPVIFQNCNVLLVILSNPVTIFHRRKKREEIFICINQCANAC